MQSGTLCPQLYVARTEMSELVAFEEFINRGVKRMCSWIQCLLVKNWF